MIDSDRIKLLVERNVQALMAANGAEPKTDADRQFVADMVELGVGMLQAFNDIALCLDAIVDRMDRDSGRIP
jgi:hypothetical protein